MKPAYLTRGLVGALVALLFTGTARATVTLDFSDLSSDSTPASALTATTSFTVSGDQLTVEIQNTSAYDIAQLYFNTDPSLTGLDFNSAGATNPNWDISGTGTDQTQKGDGMGVYNWLVDFGSGANRLDAGSTTTLVLDMTGTTSESTIASKMSTNPPGSRTALAVLKFESGPRGDSAFGGSKTPVDPPDDPPVNEIPAPATLLFALVGGGLGLTGYLRRKRA